MFYNKQIKIYNLQNGFEDEFGITHQNESYKKIKSKQVDIQPYSMEKLKKDYGYDLDCTKRMFCDLDKNITECSLIEYKEKLYKIQKITEWDDYLDIALLETDKEVILIE